MAIVIIPQHWVEEYKPLPEDWLKTNASGLLRRVPDFEAILRDVATSVGVAEHLLITRMQLEQSAITYAWDGSTKDYQGGKLGDETKLLYLCGVDKTDSGPRQGGWFGAERQMWGCALRFKYWYRGKDGPKPEWRNWMGLTASTTFVDGRSVTRQGVSITPANQASADCLRYTTSIPAQYHLRDIGMHWFREEYQEEYQGAAMAKIKAYTLEEFITQYLPAQKPRQGIKATVLHHTYRPNAAQYKGISTIEGIRNYHVNTNGWSDIGANAYAAPDGLVYNARPLSAANYAHALISRPWSQVPSDLVALANGDRQFLNKSAFGIEVIGDFDVEPLSPMPKALDTGLWVLAAVHKRYNIPVGNMFLHRDAAAKSCPGSKITRDWARAELKKRVEGKAVEEKPLILQTRGVDAPSEVIKCNLRVEDGTARVDLRPLLEYYGIGVHAQHLATLGKVFVDDRPVCG